VRNIKNTFHLLVNSPPKLLHYHGYRSPNREILPNFLGIGAQKAGTTWLHENLKKHPEIFLPKEKEIHFFNDKFSKPLNEYQAVFKGQECMLRGEINPGYSVLEKWKIEYLARILPKLKSILILRNPIERAWSHAIMSYVKMHNKTPEEIKLEDWLRHFRNPLSVKKGNYPQIIKNWQSVYASEQMKILFYDDLVATPQSFLMDVFKFLMVEIPESFASYPINEKINSGTRIVMPEKVKEALKDRYRADIYELYNSLGTPIEKWIGTYNL